MLRPYQKYILFFIIYFLLHYLEGLPPTGGLSFAQVWKLPLLAALLLYNILSLWKKTYFEKFSYLLSIEYILSPEILINPINAIVRISKQLPFILFYGFWRQFFAHRKETLEKILYGLAQFISLASAVVLLGIVHPMNGYLTAESFGIENLVYYSCVFGAPHAASSYFVASTLVLFNGFITRRFKSRWSKIFNATLIAISLISVFRAYVRTGWLMLAIGLLFFIKINRITKRQLNITLLAVTLCISGILYLYNTNEAFYARLTGKNVYTHTGGNSIDTGGSGRTVFWKNAVENLWAADSPYATLFGQGFTKVADDNYRTTGMHVFSHNQFLDALSQNGVIGLFLLLAFFGSLWRFICQKQGIHKRLCMSLFVSSVVFAFFQNEMYFDYAVIFSLAVAILECEDKEYNIEVNEYDKNEYQE